MSSTLRIEITEDDSEHSFEMIARGVEDDDVKEAFEIMVVGWKAMAKVNWGGSQPDRANEDAE